MSHDQRIDGLFQISHHQKTLQGIRCRLRHHLNFSEEKWQETLDFTVRWFDEMSTRNTSGFVVEIALTLFQLIMDIRSLLIFHHQAHRDVHPL